MHITYLLATGSNALYDGKYSQRGRYHTYGQQSFVLDLIRTMSRAGHTVRLIVDAPSSFALTSTFRSMDSVTVAEETDPSGKTDLILVDEVPDEMLRDFDEHIPAFRIVHHAGRHSSDYLVSRCTRFLCMTENALSLQRSYLPRTRQSSSTRVSTWSASPQSSPGAARGDPGSCSTAGWTPGASLSSAGSSRTSTARRSSCTWRATAPGSGT